MLPHDWQGNPERAAAPSIHLIATFVFLLPAVPVAVDGAAVRVAHLQSAGH